MQRSWRLVALVLVLGLPGTLLAKDVGLSLPEQAALKTLVEKDPSAAALAKRIKLDAEDALTAAPQPVEQIRTEGLLKGDPVKLRTLEAVKDFAKIRTLSLAWILTGDSRYAEGARRYTLAWATVNQPSGNPIDETHLEPLVEAYDETRATYPAAERDRVDRWLRAVATAQVGSRKVGKPTGMNNWNSHRLKIVGLIGYTLEDADLERYAQKGFREQVEQDLLADGSSFDFHERDALHYHVYTLEPLLRLAQVLHHGGNKVYDATATSGASLHKSVAFLLPYARGQQVHAEFASSRVRFDQERAANGEAKFKAGKAFDPKEARKALELAAYFQPELQDDVGALAGKPGTRFSSVRMLLNEVTRR